MKLLIYRLLSVLGMSPGHLLWLYRAYYALRSKIKYNDYRMFRIAAFEISTACNRKCTYCPVSTDPNSKQQRYMPYDVFITSLFQLRDMHFDGSIFYHFFNEPLMRTDIGMMIRCAKAIVPRALNRLFTNGDLLTKELAARIFEAGLDDIVVTIPGAQKDPRLVEIAQIYKGRIVLQELREESMGNRGGSVAIQPKHQPGHDYKCRSVWEELNIMYNGDVILCSSDYHRSVVLGNVMSDTLLEITARTKKIRDEIADGTPIYPVCKRCSMLTDGVA